MRFREFLHRFGIHYWEEKWTTVMDLGLYVVQVRHCKICNLRERKVV